MAADLMLTLDRRPSATPLHRQIVTSIAAAIREGRLVRGSAVPASRALASELGVSRGVVVEAYEQLVAEGLLESSPGSYTRVAALAPVAVPPMTLGEPDSLIDFGCGQVDPASFPRTAWLRSLRRVVNDTPHSRLSQVTGHGVDELRVALADYLNRVRGAQARPENVVICAGFGQASHLLLHVLAQRGARRIAVEDPSVDDDVKPTARALGLDLVGIPVTEAGWDLDALDESHADALVVTPSHQWPLGTVMEPEARERVAAWARRTNALVIEDDYDAEYRYDRLALPALQGMAPETVAYAGTASKTLVPGLRLGWMVLPPGLVDDVARAKYRVDRGTPSIDQLAFADFLQHGELDRHLRRMRPVYRRRRDLLITALARHLPALEVTGVAAGLHLLAWLPEGSKEKHLSELAHSRRVRVQGLQQYWLEPSRSTRQGIVFGYTSMSESAIVDGIAALGDAWSLTT
jgi:GntR family transcriptional regulator/MocR family aminotransferase